MVIVMKDAVTLVKVKEGYGHSAKSEEVATSVRASVSLPSTSMQFTAQSVGETIDLVVHLWRNEYESSGCTHIEYNGTRYKVITAGPSISDLMVKLTVAKK